MNEPEKWDDVTVEDWQETAFLAGVSSKGRQERTGYTITESLDELARLANSAGLQVCLSCAPSFQLLAVSYRLPHAQVLI